MSSVRASFANGRRASRASYAAGSRRVSQLARSRVSSANTPNAGSGEAGGDVSFSNNAGVDGGGEDDGASAVTKSSTGGLGSRRESAMLLVSGETGGGGGGGRLSAPAGVEGLRGVFAG